METAYSGFLFLDNILYVFLYIIISECYILACMCTKFII